MPRGRSTRDERRSEHGGHGPLRIDETVSRGTTEVWTLRNGGDIKHNSHVHDVQFRVLDVNGKRTEPALRGRKDTVAVPMGSTVRIALRFDGPSDPDGGEGAAGG
ncbi:multicopper oxidase domain-containing protein [Streptomyces rubiginosohelvolus]|uniref:multicopper oxidase domain-containing protein n=1 Tax=Streptomyces rubiginosohelvolus TaxID=67362 RepID=UPI0036DBD75B